MTHVRNTKKRWIAGGMTVLLVSALFSSLVLARPVFAQDAAKGAAELAGAQAEASCDSAPLAPPCIGRSIKDTANVLADRFVSPAFTTALVQGLLNISQFVVNRLAYESALLVANGGPAQGSLFYGKSAKDGFSEFGLAVAGEAVANLSDALNSGLKTNFDTCLSPGLPSLSLALGIKQKYQPEAPRCDIMEFIGNWESFAVDAYSSIADPDKAHSAIVAKFAESLQPGKNELSAAVEFNFKVDQQVAQQKELEKEERQTQNLKNVVDPVTKQTKTPNKVIENDFLDKLKKAITGETTQLKAEDLAGFGDAMGGLALTATSTFTNTLLSQLFTKIYNGLFDTDDGQDPFNVEAVATTGQDPEVFSRVFATTPFATADYNAITEFIVCPPQGIANRNVNNCVIDSNFLAVISRGNSGIPMTVQEAIDEGLINGNWPLISPAKLTNNQDPLCYTYGFCYSNLVKLRKARVVPIGWELAAMRNSVAQPKSLQEVINEFNNCNENGTIDAQHPFCHLVDPDWVLKYPETQCRATVNGEIRLTQLSPGRQGVCADTQSCLGENSKGECVAGFGYCVQEKNVWRFKGDECQEQYAGCLALQSTTTKTQYDFIINTVDYSVCGQSNAGCQWYRVVKDSNGDNGFDWVNSSFGYQTLDRANNYKYTKADGDVVPPIDYGSNNLASYTYQERMYLNRSAQSCSESDAGCSELYSAQTTQVNSLRNPSFEDHKDINTIPDGWFPENNAQVVLDNTKSAVRGAQYVTFSSSAGALAQYVSVQPGQSYTVSYYAMTDAPGTKPIVNIEVFDSQGDPVSLAGYKALGTGCTIGANIVSSTVSAAQEWKRFSCSFGLPPEASSLRLSLNANAQVQFDAVQLEPNEIMSNFVEGFSQGFASANYIKIAPEYMNCTGSPNDPASCTNYAQMCQAQDVGCNLYTPQDGDPSLPAITSPLDACPSECVGYDAYKQEPTKYETAKFEHFIPTQAVSCSAQDVGCDSFTNLSASTEGGEQVEYYTNLRACLTPGMTSTTDQAKQEATFYTWEGSDNTGYQLRSWSLLESNLGDQDQMQIVWALPLGTVVEQHIGKAPCTHWKVIQKDQLVCEDDASGHQASIAGSKTCNDHEDILNNPDCREFYDADGFVHYREFPKTVTVSDQCQPYRKDVSQKTDCDASGGYWDTEVGFCRYFGLTSESNVCSQQANGCRSYTGGAGRNSVTLINETFENGSYEGYIPYGSNPANKATLLISNESIATDGHSLRATASATDSGGFATNHQYNYVGGVATIYDPATLATCASPNKPTPAGCEISPDCVVAPGEKSCGLLKNKVVEGSTWVIQFWAKGSGVLRAGFKTYTETGALNTYPLTDTDGIQLNGSWNVYSLGPYESKDISPNFHELSLYFSTDAEQIFYLDNLSMKQVEENITLIKNSWVVPSTCDTAPNGVAAPQYYLGCEAYTDQNNKNYSLYQFSKLCSEQVVGCEKMYQTQESTATYGQVYNARCVDGEPATAAGGTVKLLPGETKTNARPCIVNGKTYCTIAKHQSYCTFDYDGMLPEKLPLDGTTYYGIMYGPETVIVPSDRAVYLVNNGAANCSSGAAGCQEMGKPTFSQDLSSVESFESVYFVNDPDQYGDMLCTNDALFCDEFSSTKDGNFYFKNPLDKTCEYRTDVDFGGKKLTGWFRKGKDEPCDWTDKNGDNKYTPTVDSAYIIAGNQSGMWLNGDTATGQYAGWVGTCPAQQDLCTEFIDTVDTEGGLKNDGTSYHFVNNDKLANAALTGAQTCDGKVSQKEGCALFNNRSNSELKYNASASYILSTYANELLKKSPNALVDPVSCTGTGGEFTDKNGEFVDLCKWRCRYDNIVGGDALVTNLSTKSSTSSSSYYERSCLYDTDCPVLTTKFGEKVEGVCGISESDTKLVNDSNTILQVARDRSCSAWLACGSSRTSFNQQTNKYEPICDAIDLCVSGGADGQDANCTQWDPRDPQILTSAMYATRDVSWNGSEYSGYAIPNQLPVELYNQFNVNPDKACVKNGQLVTSDGSPLKGKPAVVCTDSGPCDKAKGVYCESVEPDYRLVYNAGSCDSSNGNGSQCQVGHCSNDGKACSKNNECISGSCVIGSCQQSQPLPASGTCPSGFSKDPILKDVCIDVALGVQPCTAGTSNGCSSGQACVKSATTAIGNCFNNRCLTDIRDQDGNGFADPIDLTSAREQSCRGYPEVDSPYTANKVVESWLGPGQSTPKQSPSTYLDKPYSFKPGYQDSNACAPDAFGNPVDCDCGYDRVEYGQGAVTLFEKINTDTSKLPSGICHGGPKDGENCSSDSGCADDKNPSDAGTCLKRTTQDTLYGWSGYCIEKDSSIQLYASTDPEDRACLTWLPVDQLTGATDLYGKFTSAGFEKQDAYFCAETAVAYDIGVGGDNNSPRTTGNDSCGEYCFCAETDDGDCDNDISDDAPYKEVGCANGFFAVMGECDVGGSLCNAAAGFDDDWAYMCIPNLSYKTTETGGSVGERCEPPSPADQRAVGTSPSGIPIYYVYMAKWHELRQYYKDCEVKGVDKTTFDSYTTGSKKVLTPIPGSPIGLEYPEGEFYASQSYPVCKSEVQVARKDDTVGSAATKGTGELNVAWTNRVWEASGYTLKKTDGSNETVFGYTPATEPLIFGQAESPSARLNTNQYPDPYPHPFDVCVNGSVSIPLPANGTCPSGYQPGQENTNVARTYQDFTLDGTSASSTESDQTARDRLKQLFARSYQLLTFDDASHYKAGSSWKSFSDFEKSLQDTYDDSFPAAWNWDVRVEGDGHEKPTPPTVISLGTCVGQKCREGRTDAFTVDSQDKGDIVGEGSKKIAVSFFTTANPNQMPIRKIVVDWGDGKNDDPSWPTDSQSGSTAPDNYYKNHRGLNAGGQEICATGSNQATDFGLTPEACDPSYIAFNHDYVCSAADVEKLKKSPRGSSCEYGSDGRLLNSPCTDGQSCIFQPRVHIQDNWGWCTGFCDAGSDDGTDGCFGGDGTFGDECNISECPSEGDSAFCPDSKGGTDNPWVNYEGVVVVTPAS